MATTTTRWIGPVSIVEAPAGSRIRYTYDDPDLGVVVVEGVKAHAVGMSELGNQGFRVEGDDGAVNYCSRYATVEVAQ